MSPDDSWLLVLFFVVLPAITVGALVWWGWDSWRKYDRNLQKLRDKWKIHAHAPVYWCADCSDVIVKAQGDICFFCKQYDYRKDKR